MHFSFANNLQATLDLSVLGTPIYPTQIVFRDPLVAPDYDTAAFTRDTTWRNLDLSATIPPGTLYIFANWRIVQNAPSPPAYVGFTPGTGDRQNRVLSSEVISRPVQYWALLRIAANRLLKYRIGPAFTTFQMVIWAYIRP